MSLVKIEDLWMFIGGLGIFLLSMKFIEEALTLLSGRSFKNFFREYTKTPLRGILSGTLATAVLQSSSMVTLMILSLVGAGIIDMKSAIGVVYGSNLGTTFTGWLVTLLGFKVNLQSAVYPFIGIGGLLFALLPKKHKLSQVFRLIASIGLLMLGLEFMKQSMNGIAQGFDPSLLQGHGILSYFIFGYIFTAIIQSSSATMMITLTALNSQIFTLPSAAAIVIGADLGTTTTALLASIGASKEKKQTALAHFIFNFVTDIFALIMINPLLSFVIFALHPEEPLFSLVLFHSTFNFLGILLFVPFTGSFARLLEKHITKSVS
ncbi:MAG: Na/Pi cotransporter family protein [Bdellovibrionales bacterium]|nr:Na/Pi cotransporter family protein [Bdellovibrionales bacterium]